MAKRTLVTSTTTSLTRLDEPAVSDVTSGLVARWKLDDNLATTAVLDDTGSHNGTLNGGNNTQDLSIDAPLERGLDLDGSADYVRIPYNAAFEVSAVTVCCWVRFDGVTAWDKMFMFPYRTSGWSEPYGSYFLHRYNNSANLSFAVATGATYQQAVGSSALQTGVWYHVLGTYDGTDIKLYIDGRLDGLLNAPSTIQYDAATPDLALGMRSPYSTGEFHNGALDDARIYNRAVSAAEAKQIYQYALMTRDLGPNNVQWLKNGTSEVAVANMPFDTARQFTRASTDYIYTTSDAVKTNPFSFECWFNADSLPSVDNVRHHFFSCYNTNGTICGITQLSGVLNLFFYVQAHGTPYLYAAIPTLGTGEWHHIRVSQDSSERTMYLDGEIVAQDGGATISWTSGFRVGIGSMFGWPTGGIWQDSFDGKIADVRWGNEAPQPWEPYAVVKAAHDPVVGFDVDVDTVCCYNFNNVNDSTINGGTVYDDAGNHNGTVDGTGQYLISDHVSDLSRYIPSPGAQSVVRVPSHADFTATSDFTLEVWFRPDTVDTLRFIVCKTLVNQPGFHISQKFSDGDVLQLGLGYSGQVATVFSPQNFLAVNRWCYAALVWDVSEKTVYGYGNGVILGTATNVSIVPTSVDNAYDFCIGGDDGDTSYEFAGRVAAVRFSSRIRTAKEIFDYYNGTEIREVG